MLESDITSPVAKMCRNTISITECRPSVTRFAVLMESVLRDNDYKGGWSNESTASLYTCAVEEMKELQNAIDDDLSVTTILREAVDVSNFMMMLCEAAVRKPNIT